MKTQKILYILSIIFIALGIYKILVYKAGTSTSDGINAYVGGDAYNMILNAQYGTSLFVLALICIIIVGYINNAKK